MFNFETDSGNDLVFCACVNLRGPYMTKYQIKKFHVRLVRFGLVIFYTKN